MPDEKICLVIKNTQLGKLLKERILGPEGYQVSVFQEPGIDPPQFIRQKFDAVVVEIGDNAVPTLQFVENILGGNPSIALILLSNFNRMDVVHRGFHLGVSDILTLPLKPGDLLTAVQASLKRRSRLQSWVQRQTRRNTDYLRHHVDELKELENIGRSITASLDLDHVLTEIVDTAVKLTGAEEGSLLILDEDSGELFMRAARNFQDEFVRTFRIPVTDSLAGEVIRNGTPVIINDDTPQKIKTRYLVRTLMYVPLQFQGKVIGVLGVDNRERVNRFTEQHLSLVSTLADYAVIAIENARHYQNKEVDRQKLDSILTQIEDGVIVIGSDRRVVLINRIARNILGIEENDTLDKPIDEVIQNDALLEILTSDHLELPYRCEISLDDGYIMNTQLVQIPGVGFALTMQDISYFKELDRIKTEFVQTVSHDLRSPLTAILGYVELIPRVGEINKQQQEFIDRVQISVRNIAELINNLLELGRIEAGFDTSKEFIPIGVIMQYAIEGVRKQLNNRQLKLTVDIPTDIPYAYGDPVRLRKVVDVLLNNAVTYTPNQGNISLRLSSKVDQIILQVEDDGEGIPLQDQPYIFEKFFRASNVPENINGSGLGLAIVKSIVDNHHGRVWVNSTVGIGSCFTVMLPIVKQNGKSA